MIRNEAVTVLRLDNVQHNQAAAQAAQAIGKVGATGEASAGQIRAAMRSLPAQFTDVATQLAGGQNPMLILLQQGGQVRDQFGSISAALRGVIGFIGPVGLVAAAVGAIGAAALAAERDTRKLYDMLALTGGASGLTADRLRTLAEQVSSSSRATAGEAKDMVVALASQGTISARVIDSMAVAAQRVADLSGKSANDVAADFAKMAGGVADWAAEHNKAWNFLTFEQYQYIKRLEEQGKAEEAMIYVSKQAAGAHETQAKNLGTLERAWLSVQKSASDAWSAMLGIGRKQTLGEQIESVKRELASFDANMPGGTSAMVDGERLAAIRAQREQLATRLQSLQSDARQEARLADDRAQRTATERAKIQAERDKPKGGRPGKDPNLMNWNSLGLFVGPEQFDFGADEYRRNELRRSELAGTEATNAAMREAADRRMAAQRSMLADLVKANEDANLQLIADDQQRAMAQINLERSRLQKQIEEVYGNTPARAEAEAAADAAAETKRQAAGQKFAKDTALVTREETRDALAAAFRDSKNPLRAFGDALGNIVFQRVSTSLADALLTAAFGSGGGFGGGLLGSLIGGFTGGPAGLLAGATGFGDYNAVAALAGARANGGPVMPGEAYLVGERGPEILRMGRQGGTVIPNHAIGGAAPVTVVQHISIGQGVSRNEVMMAMHAAEVRAVSAVAQTQRRSFSGPSA